MDFLQRLFGRSKQQSKQITEEQSGADPQAEEVLETLDETQQVDVAEGATTPLQTRPLPPPQPFTSKSQRIMIGQASDPGQMRDNNQDACLSLLANPNIAGNPPAIGFFVVADGMGGHRDGELASAVTVQTLVSHVIEDIILPHLDGRDHSADQKTIPEVLSDAMLTANTVVQGQVPNGGTTATCAVIRGDLAYISHVGDSRAYLITSGNMELVTRDHSLVRRLQELGQLTEDEAEVHPQRNVLYRAIGQGDALEVDSATRRLPPSSRLLICSDGAWGVLGDERVAKILAEHEDPQEACDHIVAAANESGGPDNISAVLIQMPD